jgi:hypothetical protein
MKRSVVAVALMGALAFIPGAGHASSVQAGTCSVNGQVTFANPVTAVPGDNEFSFSGPIQCSGISSDGTPSAPSQTLTGGDFAASGQASLACEVGSATGMFEADFPTGQDAAGNDTRDAWKGQLSTIGGPVSAVQLTIQSIEHQTFVVTDPDTGDGEWQATSTDTVGLNAGAGEFLFTVDDPTQCAGDGVTAANVASQVVFGFAADPQAAE